LKLRNLRLRTRNTLHEQSHQELCKSTYRALVLDFDDTLCGRAERFGKLKSDIVVELERLAAARIPIGIATGRGRSVRIQLRSSIAEKHWSAFTIGYYNGSEIASLGDDTKPVAGDAAEGILGQAANLLLDDDVAKVLANITVRRAKSRWSHHTRDIWRFFGERQIAVWPRCRD
jgi:hydroxymethylpyrimidine pyrophosphatase-like HAD family hydrolase